MKSNLPILSNILILQRYEPHNFPYISHREKSNCILTYYEKNKNKKHTSAK